ncbi:MAG: STAS domain-containing protein [Chlorobi bacterium]|nr:STAS domain-containing protein [Chlorobiota bacterium]
MNVQRIGNAAVVVLEARVLGGQLSVELADQLRRLVSEGVEHVVFDCSNVELINSSGIGMLVAALTTLRSHHGRCTLAAVPEKMRTLLSITHLDSIFALSDSVSDALA